MPEDDDIVDLEAEFADETAASTEKVKPLRMKVSRAKERALMREFGLDETALTEEEATKRRSELKTLIKMGKTRGFLTPQEINDHLHSLEKTIVRTQVVENGIRLDGRRRRAARRRGSGGRRGVGVS